jgi:hypothetical protein
MSRLEGASYEVLCAIALAPDCAWKAEANYGQYRHVLRLDAELTGETYGIAVYGDTPEEVSARIAVLRCDAAHRVRARRPQILWSAEDADAIRAAAVLSSHHLSSEQYGALRRMESQIRRAVELNPRESHASA